LGRALGSIAAIIISDDARHPLSAEDNCGLCLRSRAFSVAGCLVYAPSFRRQTPDKARRVLRSRRRNPDRSQGMPSCPH